MGKGEETRLAVLDQAVDVARRVGLSGLTIGRLAEQTALSKSGLFGHFRSKEALQLQVLEHARTRFEEAVARPALRTTRGEPRIRALFEHWIAWDARPGGRPFAAASTEFDDQPGRCGTASSATTGTYWTWSLYLNPPDKAIVLCVDERSQIQALDRTAPVYLPNTSVSGGSVLVDLVLTSLSFTSLARNWQHAMTSQGRRNPVR